MLTATLHVFEHEHLSYFSPSGRVCYCQTCRQIAAEWFCPDDLVMWVNLRSNLLARFNSRVVSAGPLNSMCLNFTTAEKLGHFWVSAAQMESRSQQMPARAQTSEALTSDDEGEKYTKKQ